MNKQLIPLNNEEFRD